MGEGSAPVAVIAALVTEFVFDVGFSVARGTHLQVGYLALCGALAIAAGLLCLWLPRSLRASRTRAALVLYVLLHGFVTAQSPVWRLQLSILAMAAATWFFLAPGRLPRVGSFARGVIVAVALCIAIAVWPYASVQFPGPIQEHEALVQAIVYATVLAGAWVWEVRRPRLVPPFASVGIVGLAVSMSVMKVGVDTFRPQLTSVRHTASATPVAPLPDVFLLVLDTVRADHLSVYGYDRETTPWLAKFLAQHPEAMRYELAFSTSSWTIPAHGSLLSGLMQSVHNARGYAPTASIDFRVQHALGEVMREAGYCTAAIVANPFLLRVAGFKRGFDTYYQPPPTRPLLLLGEGLRRQFLPWAYAGRIRPQPLADVINSHLWDSYQSCEGQPAFILANYMDAHSPYLAPSPHAGIFANGSDVPLNDAEVSDPADLIARKRARYDEEIHFLDAQLGELLQRMESDRILDGSWVFVTADHGEAFLEHASTSHGSSIYNEQVRVPLIVKPPHGVTLPAVSDPVSLLDVAATIAGIVGRGQFGVGRDLRQRSPSPRAVGILFRGTFRDVKRFGAIAGHTARSAVSGRWKVIERGGSYELYDLVGDPDEIDDRSAEHGELVRELAAQLPGDPPSPLPEEAVVAPRNEGPTLGRDEAEALRKLGYVE